MDRGSAAQNFRLVEEVFRDIKGRSSFVLSLSLGLLGQEDRRKRERESDRNVGGRDTVLVDALSRHIPLVSDQPTIIFDADVTHPHLGEDSSSSIAVVVATQDWLEVTKYAGLENEYLHRMGVLRASSPGWGGTLGLAKSLVKKVVKLDVHVDKYPSNLPPAASCFNSNLIRAVRFCCCAVDKGFGSVSSPRFRQNLPPAASCFNSNLIRAVRFCCCAVDKGFGSVSLTLSIRPQPHGTATTTGLLGAVVALLLAACLFSILRKRDKRLPPGPTLWPLVGSLIPLLQHRPHFRWVMAEADGKDITCIRLGIAHVVVVNSPELACEFLKRHDANFASRPLTVATKHSSRNFLSVIFSPLGPQWKKMRRMIASEVEIKK
ncbi:hypothetical protein ZIOFF_006466 [Zingiber officinale]|uniref:Uncharacterized protein n=1 Tax=Zingiber officinale TaxID=94328 RepID=A0A8J5LVP1_ZINOF|nr:hypothetical protein ZIOFF_006466 [Zingiber officinale]